jgi:hypothetical protein
MTTVSGSSEGDFAQTAREASALFALIPPVKEIRVLLPRRNFQSHSNRDDIQKHNTPLENYDTNEFFTVQTRRKAQARKIQRKATQHDVTDTGMLPLPYHKSDEEMADTTHEEPDMNEEPRPKTQVPQENQVRKKAIEQIEHWGDNRPIYKTTLVEENGQKRYEHRVQDYCSGKHDGALRNEMSRHIQTPNTGDRPEKWYRRFSWINENG